MSQKHVFRHRFTAQHTQDIEYDPSKPETYQAALEKVAETRKGLVALGCTIMIDMGKPIALREKAEPAQKAAE